MANSNAVTSQGTLLKRNGTVIGELKDITPPDLERKELEVTTHNSSDAQYIVGIRRKGQLQVLINFLPSGDATHGSANGLIAAWINGSKDLYEIDYPDGAVWLWSGFVVMIAPKQPVDGIQEATVTIRPTAGHIFTP